MYFHMFAQMKKMLGQLDGWLEVAAKFAEEKKFDPDLFVGFRLAPDQFALARQVQTACDTVKLAASRLTAKDAPTHPDDEVTIEQLRARVRSVVGYLDGFTEADFADAATRVITQARWEGKVMSGADFFVEHAVPNFFFHLSHVYAILRHNCVPIGKRNYLGALSRRDP
jgi:hypothetical protein